MSGRLWRALPAAGLLLLCAALAAASTAPRDAFLSTPSTQKYVVIFAGLGVDVTADERFRQWSLQLYAHLHHEYGYRPEQITLLQGRTVPTAAHIAGPCRRETMLAALTDLHKKVRPGDQITFVFIGHGTSDAQTAKFVIAGPDITGAEFAAQLAAFAAQDIAVLHTGGGSYPFCDALATPGRVILCATRSRAEIYDTMFAPFLLEALAQHAADRDKNGRVSLFEIFLFVRQRVKTWYDDQGRLPSEHPTLDDNGDGHFQIDPHPGQDDGSLAQIAYLDTLTADLPEATDDQTLQMLRTLLAKTQALERGVFLLRHQKANLTVVDYRQRMEDLLIELARTMQQLRRLRDDMQFE